MSSDRGPSGTDVADRVRTFIDEQVIPVEREWLPREAPVSPDVLEALRSDAREAGVFAPQVGEAFGGLGLGFDEMLPVFEAAGRSLLGAHALRCAAPDEGNMATLERFGTQEQQDRWLRPIVSGEIDSGFAMTEPLDGGGSDPKMLQTTALLEGDEWVIDGHKWWTTGGADAEVLLVFARSDMEAHPYEGCSVIIVPRETPGVDMIREIPHMGEIMQGTSHAEFRFEDVRVPAENLLGPQDGGFKLVQQRLGPARLTHCMRYLGMAQRAIDIAVAYLSERHAFGEPIAAKQGPRFELADRLMELRAAHALVQEASGKIAGGNEARIEVAMAKTFTANVTQAAIDSALQYCGGNGIARDLPIANFYEMVRQFRLVDGADEVHRRSIARSMFTDPAYEELENITRFGEPSR